MDADPRAVESPLLAPRRPRRRARPTRYAAPVRAGGLALFALCASLLVLPYAWVVWTSAPFDFLQPAVPVLPLMPLAFALVLFGSVAQRRWSALAATTGVVALVDTVVVSIHAWAAEVFLLVPPLLPVALNMVLALAQVGVALWIVGEVAAVRIPLTEMPRDDARAWRGPLRVVAVTLIVATTGYVLCWYAPGLAGTPYRRVSLPETVWVNIGLATGTGAWTWPMDVRTGPGEGAHVQGVWNGATQGYRRRDGEWIEHEALFYDRPASVVPTRFTREGDLRRSEVHGRFASYYRTEEETVVQGTRWVRFQAFVAPEYAFGRRDR